MNKGDLVQGDAHQLLEEFNSSAQISAFQVLALVSIMFLCLWRGKPDGGAGLVHPAGGLHPILVTPISSAWANPGPSHPKWTPVKNPKEGGKFGCCLASPGLHGCCCNF